MRLSLVINAAKIKLDEQKLKKLKINLNKLGIEYRFVAYDLLHINLLNLGDLNKDKVEEIDALILSLVSVHGPFDLKLNGMQAYPNEKEGRLIWIGVQNSLSLRSLQEDLARSLIDPLDFRDDKVFRPILPIVRMKNHHDLSDILSPFKRTDFGKLSTEELVLYEMVSGGAFPVYKQIKRYYLNPALNRRQPEFNAD